MPVPPSQPSIQPFGASQPQPYPYYGQPWTHVPATSSGQATHYQQQPPLPGAPSAAAVPHGYSSEAYGHTFAPQAYSLPISSPSSWLPNHTGYPNQGFSSVFPNANFDGANTLASNAALGKGRNPLGDRTAHSVNSQPSAATTTPRKRKAAGSSTAKSKRQRSTKTAATSTQPTVFGVGPIPQATPVSSTASGPSTASTDSNTATATPNPPTLPPASATSSTSTSGGPSNTRTSPQKATSNLKISAYLNSGFVAEAEAKLGFDIVRYWQLKALEFPTLYRIALDVLPVQASAVPCERVFSSSKETCSLRRSNMSPKLMEALQSLKYHFLQDRLDLTPVWFASTEEFQIDAVTPKDIEDLIAVGKIDELEDLLRSQRAQSSESVSG